MSWQKAKKNILSLSDLVMFIIYFLLLNINTNVYYYLLLFGNISWKVNQVRQSGDRHVYY